MQPQNCPLTKISLYLHIYYFPYHCRNYVIIIESKRMKNSHQSIINILIYRIHENLTRLWLKHGWLLQKGDKHLTTEYKRSRYFSSHTLSKNQKFTGKRLDIVCSLPRNFLTFYARQWVVTIPLTLQLYTSLDAANTQPIHLTQRHTKNSRNIFRIIAQRSIIGIYCLLFPQYST